ncbi:MAG: hypothetical protein U5K55_03575 [Aliarcobacter sp.]|nr:hypothetical protein [Aliarcobacter sp.]
MINGDEKVNTEFKTYNPNSKLTNTAIDLSNSVKNTQTTTTNDKTVNLIQIEELNSLKNDETYELPTNKYGMFTTVNPNKNLNYLVESNPLYTNLSNFTGSQYFLDKMNYQGDRITKRLGDAGYETKLISDSIVKQTGKRFLGNYTSENAQFVALMDSAINLSGILGLEIGQALTQTQLSNLTEDIVWMEEKIVADQKVLVPVVYLAKDYEYLKGATITAQKGIDLKTGNLTNTGTMKSGDYLKLDSKSITNNQGVILANGKATLISDEDFINKNGGIIKASEVQIASINGSIINQTFAQTNKIQQGSNDFTYTLLGNESNIQSTKGNLILQAKNNIDNIGGSFEASKTLSLNSENGDVNFKTLYFEKWT